MKEAGFEESCQDHVIKGNGMVLLLHYRGKIVITWIIRDVSAKYYNVALRTEQTDRTDPEPKQFTTIHPLTGVVSSTVETSTDVD